MTKKDVENIMNMDEDEVSIELAKAMVSLSDLIRKEDDADKLSLYRQARHFVSRAMECLSRVLLLEYPDLEDDSEE